MDSFDPLSGGIEVKLDGVAVEVPSERRSFSAIRSYLEFLALQQQRILYWISVDGKPAGVTQPNVVVEAFARAARRARDAHAICREYYSGVDVDGSHL